MKKRCCIIGAAPIENYKLISSYIKDDDFLVFCDGGLKHKEGLMHSPDLIVGDFDSHKLLDFPQETIVLPRKKDDTDTFFAAKEALNRGYTDFLLLGCTGLRFDHTMGNIGLMLMLFRKGATVLLVDDFGELEVVGKNPLNITSSFPYFSLLSIDGEASGIYIEDALYPLEDACFTTDFPLGISNEPLPGKTARVWVNEGNLLLYRVFDS